MHPVVASFGAEAGKSYVDVVVTPGKFEDQEKRPVGDRFYVEHAKEGANDYQRTEVSGEEFT